MVSENLSKTSDANSLTTKQLARKLNEYISELPADIRDHIIEVDFLGVTLDHPHCFLPAIMALVTSPLLTPEKITESIRSSQALFAELCASGDFDGAIFLISKRHRREYLLDLINEHGAAEMLDAINSVWVGVDLFHGYYDLWSEVWEKVVELGEARLGVMDENEREFFDTLPDTLTVYRGFRDEFGEFGWSWTLDLNQAKWFARRGGVGPSMVATVTVPKKEVLAYFNSRNEAEIVIHPNYLDCCAEFQIDVLDEEGQVA